jgi:signal transduction histidine kinase
VGLEQTADGLVFSVEDDGRGLPGNLAHDLTRPGSLGMRLVGSLVLQLDARLEVTSVPDRGTRFQITLPAP